MRQRRIFRCVYNQIYSSAGLDENKPESNFLVYPNPAHEDLSLKVSGFVTGIDYSVVIFNAAGMQVREIKIRGGHDEVRLNAGSFEPGIYFAFLKDDSGILAGRKFIIVK